MVLEHLELQLDRLLGYREAMAVGVFIDDAIAVSIAAFVRHHEQHIRDIERASTEALREAQSRKDDFLTLVVHELRNPIAPIVNGIEAIGVTLREADPRVRDAVHIIKRQSKHLARILDDVADLSQMARGRLKLHPDVIDIAEVVDQAMHSCEALMAERQHRVIRDVPAGSLIVSGDSTRLVQVFVNLLNNAARYTRPGGEVTLTARRRDDHIEISIRDNGTGIAPELLSRIFDMYTRSDEAAAAAPSGLGIGLALVRQLIALHGGNVEARSGGVGKGAEFIVTLPAYTGSDQVKRPTPEPVRLSS